MFTITEEDIKKYTKLPLSAIIRPSPSKCPDCCSPFQFKSEYFLIDETISQYKKQHLICNCNDYLWINFNKVPEEHKWIHDLQYPYLFPYDDYSDLLESILVKIPIKDISILSETFSFLEDYFNSEIGNGKHKTPPYKWYYKIVSDAIELGLKIETLPLLLCKTFASNHVCMNWTIKNTIQEIVQYNPSKFNE